MFKTVLTRLIPWYAVHAYRAVPGSIRGRYPGCPTPSSHMALDWMSQGMNGWTAISRAVALTIEPASDDSWIR